MTRIAPPGDRATLTDAGDSIELAIPNKKNWFLSIFLFLWMFGWVFGLITGIAQLSIGDDRAPRTFLLFWLVGWSFGGIFIFAIWAWLTFGRERIHFRGDSIHIRREALGAGFTREYDSGHAHKLRVGPESMNFGDFRSMFRMWGVGGGIIAFDYGSSTVRFGASLDEAEASRHVATIQQRFPSLRGV